jgi:hypothetical protein
MVIGRNRPDPTKKTQQFGAAAAHRPPIAVDQHCKDHLPQIGATCSRGLI